MTSTAHSTGHAGRRKRRTPSNATSTEIEQTMPRTRQFMPHMSSQNGLTAFAADCAGAAWRTDASGTAPGWTWLTDAELTDE